MENSKAWLKIAFNRKKRGTWFTSRSTLSLDTLWLLSLLPTYNGKYWWETVKCVDDKTAGERDSRIVNRNLTLNSRFMWNWIGYLIVSFMHFQSNTMQFNFLIAFRWFATIVKANSNFFKITTKIVFSSCNRVYQKTNLF